MTTARTPRQIAERVRSMPATPLLAITFEEARLFGALRFSDSQLRGPIVLYGVPCLIVDLPPLVSRATP